MISDKELKITKTLVREFLFRLVGREGCQFYGDEWRCGGPDYVYAKKILNLMNIPEEEQEKFIELCKEYGGYCDCEILMNAAPYLLGEETPW